MTRGAADPVGLRPTDPAAGAGRLPVVAAVAAALGWLGFLVWRTLVLTGGAFIYPLDDAYIHLAMAEGILAGGYGINPGEAAAASSSPIWPFLLGLMGAKVFGPLVLNGVALAGAAAAIGWVLARSGIAPAIAFVAALAAPIAFNLPAVAFLGMEHTAHLFAALLLLIGLHKSLESGQGNLLLWAGALLGPAFRFEALAFGEAAALVLILSGQRRLGLWVGFAGLVPVAGFALFLLGQGLAPVPASVLVKLGEAGTGAGVFDKIAINLSTRMGLVICLFAAVTAGLAGTSRDRAARGTLGSVTIALLAHLVFGRIGWAYRYENYALVLGGVAVLWFGLARLGSAERAAPRGVAVLLVMLVPLGAMHWQNLTRYGPQSALGLHLQQTQMARLARDVWGGAVAVNDFGRVTYQNDAYVADLWGLAAPAAFASRMDPRRPVGWADALIIQHKIDLAMIYTASLPRAAGPGWVRLGTLSQDGPAPYLAGLEVDIYATNITAEKALADAIQRWSADLPKGAVFAPATGRP